MSFDETFFDCSLQLQLAAELRLAAAVKIRAGVTVPVIMLPVAINASSAESAGEACMLID
jgi:hypothetical protein